MGYTKIVQYGDITEKYDYEKELHRKFTQSHFKASRLLFGVNVDGPQPPLSLAQKRKKQGRLYDKSRGVYERSRRSVKRSRESFFRLCHHNACNADSIHFLTITFAYDITFEKAGRHVRRFMEKITSLCRPIPISYISVPELTEAGRYHFHLLVFDLPTRVAGEPRWYKTRKGNVWYTTERETRNLQRLFERGYVDIRPTTYRSEGIAGYMAKYMGKNLTDAKSQSERGYTCSRNIKKIYSAGSNSLDQYTDFLIPQTGYCKVDTYDVPYLGRCIKTTTKKINYGFNI